LDSIVEYDWQLSLGEDELPEAEFDELSRLKVPLIQVRGQWMELRPQDIEAAIEFLRNRKDQKMTLAEALRLGLGQGLASGYGLDLAGGATDTKFSLPVPGFQAEGRIKEILEALSDPGGHLEPIQTPCDFCDTLRPYQFRGVSWLMYLNHLGLGACLADDMGWERPSS
jgi:SNF2 family DNA or RNA helicase